MTFHLRFFQGKSFHHFLCLPSTQLQLAGCQRGRAGQANHGILALGLGQLFGGIGDLWKNGWDFFLALRGMDLMKYLYIWYLFIFIVIFIFILVAVFLSISIKLNHMHICIYDRGDLLSKCISWYFDLFWWYCTCVVFARQVGWPKSGSGWMGLFLLPILNAYRIANLLRWFLRYIWWTNSNQFGCKMVKTIVRNRAQCSPYHLVN